LRQCIGTQFSLIEQRMYLTRLLQQYKVEDVNNNKLLTKSSLLLLMMNTKVCSSELEKKKKTLKKKKKKKDTPNKSKLFSLCIKLISYIITFSLTHLYFFFRGSLKKD